MRTLNLFTLFIISSLLALLLHGCVFSVHPLFTKEDLVFREEIIGKWKQDDSVTWEFNKSDDPHYEVIHIDNDDTTYLAAGLGQLGDLYYFDFYVGDLEKLTDLENLFLFPTHSFAKVSFEENKITLEWFATEWLEDLIKDKRIRIKHELANDQVLLTASTEELQKFIQKYANEPKAFDEQENLIPINK